jgi:methionyl-tRNA formyltransferase
MKKITAFTLTDNKGFFIDLEDAELAVTVTPNDGDILLHEGEGPGRFDGVSLSGNAVEEIQINRTEAGIELIVKFRRGQRSESHLLGITQDDESAAAWVERVNKIYEIRRNQTVESRGRPTMKILFMGTSEFAVPSLEKLIEAKFDLIGVVTQPDRPSGRGKRLTPPPVKVVAEKHGLPVYQPERVRKRDALRELKTLQPTVIVVVAFGQILPKSLLELAPCGCINIHPSLLPKYRGAAPIQWALINGETETGVTIMRLDEGEDTGDIIRQERVKIQPEETATTLFDRLAHRAASLLVEVLENTPPNAPPPHTPQNHAEATHAPRLTKDTGNIDWEKPAEAIRNLVRGTAVWPGAYTFFEDNLRLKVIECTVVDYPNPKNFLPGTIEITSAPALLVFTGEGALRLDRVQPATKKAMSAADLINGYRLKTGVRFVSESS